MSIYWPVVENMHEQRVRERFEAPHPDFEADVIVGDADALTLATVHVAYATKLMIDRKMALRGEAVFFFSVMTRDAKRKNSERDAIAMVFARLMREALTEKELTTVVARNRKERTPRLCHSHDFLDANMLILDATATVLGEPTDQIIDRLGRDGIPVMGEAWDLARVHDFLPLEPWITLTQLMAGQRTLNPGIDPRELSITTKTRDEILVWFDAHET